MTSRQLILLLVILVGLGIIVTAGKFVMDAPASATPSPEPVSTSNSTSTSTNRFTLSIGQRGGTPEFRIEPIEVIEDSRCGINVVCIQAGTVRLNIEVNSTEQTIELDKEIAVDGKRLSLVQVAPSAYAGREISKEEYRFTFEVK